MADNAKTNFEMNRSQRGAIGPLLSAAKSELTRPALKSGVRIWRSPLSGRYRIGTRLRNLPLDGLGSSDSLYSFLKLIDGRRSIDVLAKSSGLALDEVNSMIASLCRSGFIDLEPGRVRATPMKGSAIDSATLREQQLAIERAAITFHPGAIDGGYAIVARRAIFKILIFGSGRVAIALLGALHAAGFDSIGLINRTPRGSSRHLVQGEDLAGGFFRKSEILHRKDVLLKERSGWLDEISSKKIDRPNLIVSVGAPSFDAQQRWMSETTVHLIIDYENSAEVRVGPLVLPGQSACLNCLEISQMEAGLDLPERPVTPVAELASGLALHIAGIVTLDICNYADHGSSHFLGSTLEIGSSQFLSGKWRGLSTNPRCGCERRR